MRIQTYREFWPFYLKEHSSRANRRLHFMGTTLALALIVAALAMGRYELFLGAAVSGYAFAWVGHFVLEKNRPATFKYPLWSLVSDWRMWFLMLTGRMKF